MKILGINSSPRRKNSSTLKLVEAVLDGAKQRGAETELVDVAALDIGYCLGCQVCYAKGECIQKDDLTDLWEKMMRADGIVLGSPVYINGVTAQLKTVIDRLADAIHCQLLVGKYGCAVTTAGSSGINEVLRYMAYFLNQLGAVTVGQVGVAVGRNPDALEPAVTEASELGKTLADAIRDKRRYVDQENAIAERGAFFRQLVEANKEAWAHQYDYWMEKGWM
ncbi:MAG TPA: flavodoxin family protein [Candidatus Bathyarchaeia archaeon]|nr:flavodoxin family protein [Candidatus Bathyarchaeia archaeon]